MPAIVITPITLTGCVATSTDSPLGVSDERLVQAAKGGQSMAFATLCERYSNQLFRAARRITKTREDAEDAVQDALVQAFAHLKDFEGRSNVGTWLTRIAINSALMLLRKKRATPLVPVEESTIRGENGRTRELPGAGPSPEVICLQRERERSLSMALSELTPALREAIELRELRELSVQETARVLGISVSAVKGRVFHGRRKLGKMLHPNGELAPQRGRQLANGIRRGSSCFFKDRKRRRVYEAA
jgi:RNA polymerase sigma factor (sigma-70 family)